MAQRRRWTARQPVSGPAWEWLLRPNPYLSDGALWLIDAMGCYLAALYTAVILTVVHGEEPDPQALRVLYGAMTQEPPT